MNTRTKNTGFAMLEVLVSLVLVTTVGVAIIMWAESGLHSVSRLRNEYSRMQSIHFTQDWIRSLPDNQDKNQGETILGHLKIKWKRELLTQASQVGYPRGIGSHDVFLYSYEYSVYQHFDDQEVWFNDSAVVTKSRKVREFKPPFDIPTR